MGFTWSAALWIVVAFTAARFAAMGFNRIVDRHYDAQNPRTAQREIPSGKLSVHQAAVAVVLANLADGLSPDEIIRSVDRGLYCVSYSGGQVNISNGDFVFSVTEGYMIEDGKVTAPIRGVNLIGADVVEVLPDRDPAGRLVHDLGHRESNKRLSLRRAGDVAGR